MTFHNILKINKQIKNSFRKYKHQLIRLLFQFETKIFIIIVHHEKLETKCYVLIYKDFFKKAH